ncbi:MAG: hypothetical protein HYU97_06055 [Deltaproteobacteria bacterium]|nr:hypothetical protein [Deltaproteobacteria bacterium]
MKRFSQVFKVSLLLIVALTFVQCGKGCGKKPEGVGQAAKGISYISKDANFVLSGNWKKILTSPFGAQIITQMPEQVKQVSDKVESFYVFLNFKGSGVEPKPAVLLTGSFEEAAILNSIRDMAQKSGGEVTSQEHGGKKIYTNSKKPNEGFAILDANNIVIGDTGSVQATIDTAAKKAESIEANGDMMNLIKGMNKEKMVWGVSKIPAGAIPEDPSGGANNPLADLNKVSAIDFALDFTADKFLLDVGALTANEDSAKKIVGSINTFITMIGAAMAQQDPNMDKLLKGLTIGSTKDRITLSLNVDKATVEALSQKAIPPKGNEEPPPVPVQ